MPVSVDYVARETASNLWRNRLMTIAAVLTGAALWRTRRATPLTAD